VSKMWFAGANGILRCGGLLCSSNAAKLHCGVFREFLLNYSPTSSKRLTVWQVVCYTTVNQINKRISECRLRRYIERMTRRRKTGRDGLRSTRVGLASLAY
jgi:hypothetical protein